MFLDIVLILAGFIILIKGADYFINGSVVLCEKLNVSQMVMGITVVAVGTSLPELFINISTYERGLDSALIGNVIGSNLFNFCFILGSYALLKPINNISVSTFRFDLPFAEIMAIVFWLFATTSVLPGFKEFDKNQNYIDLTEGIIIGLLYCFFLFKSYQKLPTSSSNNEPKNKVKTSEENKVSLNENKEGILKKYYLLSILIGIAGLYFGSELTVAHSVSLASSLGLSEAFIGVFILAVGTSLPELITTLVAIRKQYGDIALGNIIGSSICNIGLLIPVFAFLRPILYTSNFNVSLTTLLLTGGYLVVSLLLRKNKRINRFDGFLLLAVYVLNSIYFYIEQVQ